MIQVILKRYDELKSYSKVAKEFHIKWITVKRHVIARSSKLKTSGQSTMHDTSTQNEAADESASVHKGKFAKFIVLLESGKSVMDAAIEVDLSDSEAERFVQRYSQLKRMQLLNDLYTKKPKFLEKTSRFLILWKEKR